VLELAAEPIFMHASVCQQATSGMADAAQANIEHAQVN